ncbi:putative Ca2+/H+ antiporter (TMEM165/GDT1 family) [Herbihabitans rhizosphaerae]|uniref:GDT1 family protein n=1 Tax=Herbihabitans rhizosphaerae TaxID=1872711 RepID=A0A4Q7L8H3_9PSEU|nr:TMEM165/GDT1 family protein [Herbihabitans rhizosphaerae]RZS45230.1 putative Ca2+/H+ antiporter (TMEM165/GDT1 family) [Herbihabitans rhizosphaerae]
MGNWLLAFVSAFGLVFLVELPDKTLVATLVLTTRYRALPVFVGVVAAFAVQCVIAVLFGSVLTLLPDRAVAGVVALLFAIGAFFLLREGFGNDDDDGDGENGRHLTVSFARAALTSFGVLFAAEWGDASQLATAGLTARYGNPIAVGLGAWVALATVAGIAVLIGQRIRDRIKPHLVQRVGGFVFAAFALIALWEAISG